MSSLISHISEIPNVTIRGRSAADEAIVEKDGGLKFVVTIPHATLEWFVSASVDAKQVWSDWFDYYPIDNETDETLRAEMGDEVLRFVQTLAGSQVRLVANENKVPGQAIEWRINDSWQKIGAFAA
jgi:hypothetical protein